ncbi:MAG: BMP family ABC transporter substrate-binding protein [Propionibacteriaceae bacterium]|nr:BMP family ABC transporter substrate-binding protein [Propionibacteriaceae bacterium]
MKKTAVVAAVVAATALALSACSGSDSGSEKKYLACMVSDSGGFEDKSFNQSGYEGLEQAVSDLGVQKASAESKDAADFAPNIDAMVDQGCDLTITVGYLLAEATGAAADANPDKNFAIIDDNSLSQTNVKSLIFKTSDAAFLAGYVAAGYSTTGTVATFGGMQIPTVTIFMDGFVDGVAKYNEDNGTSVKVLGWDKAAQNGSFSGDFEDQAKGKNLSEQFIQQGADVIMPVAGPVGAGTLQAAQEAGDVAVIWVDADGALTNPDSSSVILTSVMKEIGAAVFDTIKASSTTGFNSEPYVGTLANGGVDIAPFHDFDSKVSDDLKAKVDDLRQQIIDGTLKVTSPSDPA